MITRNKVFREKAPKRQKTQLEKERDRARRQRRENEFLFIWNALNGPALVREHRFHPTRKWRCDFAHLQTRVIIEIEGGTWSKKKNRHTTGNGYADDREKYNSAQELGWKVFSLTSDMITAKQAERIIAVINSTTWRVES